MKKIYIVKYTKVNRAGAWRDYKKEVVTDDIADYVINKMKLSRVTARSYSDRKGLFLCAIEVEKSDRNFYKYRGVAFGEYWYNVNDQIVQGMSSDLVKYYDYKLKEWIVG